MNDNEATATGQTGGEARNATEPIADGKWHGIKHARAAIDDDPKRAAEYDRLVADHPALAKIVKAQDDARIQRAAAQKETT